MTERFAIGSYTTHTSPDIDAHGRGVSIVQREDTTGKYRIVDEYSGVTNPTYLDWRPELGRLYAVSVTGDGHGAVATFSVDQDGVLSFLGQQPGPGRSGCHLTALPEYHRLFATSYSDGRLTGYPMDGGDVAAVDYDFSYSGRGPHTGRQDAPHAHQVLKSPHGPVIYVCDLGSDTVWMHRLDAMQDGPVRALDAPPGCGPRHLAFDPSAPVCYVLCELIPKLLVAAIDADGGMRIIRELDTVPAERAETASPAAVKVHPSGKTVVVSNRFDDSITVFRIERGEGGLTALSSVTLEEIANFDCRGKTPRDITFSSDGSALFIANQDSHSITCRRFDGPTGEPTDDWAPTLDTGSPVCVVMLDG